MFSPVCSNVGIKVTNVHKQNGSGVGVKLFVVGVNRTGYSHL